MSVFDGKKTNSDECNWNILLQDKVISHITNNDLGEYKVKCNHIIFAHSVILSEKNGLLIITYKKNYKNTQVLLTLEFIKEKIKNSYFVCSNTNQYELLVALLKKDNDIFLSIHSLICGEYEKIIKDYNCYINIYRISLCKNIDKIILDLIDRSILLIKSKAKKVRIFLSMDINNEGILCYESNDCDFSLHITGKKYCIVNGKDNIINQLMKIRAIYNNRDGSRTFISKHWCKILISILTLVLLFLFQDFILSFCNI